MPSKYGVIYGLAKSKELQLSDDELHAVVFGVTGKESLKILTDRQIQAVVIRLQELKDGVKRNRKHDRSYSRRTGRTGTKEQRKKIFMLMNDLGWNEERVKGLAKKLFKVDAIEWLGYEQCSKLIEAMKAILSRQEKQDG